MTGTAQTSAEEFLKVYGLEVISIPTNKLSQRVDLADYIFQSEKGKIASVVKRVKELNQKGQPVLIGTASIEKNEILSAYFKKEGIEHKILNAKNHEEEGNVIAGAGRKGSVVIATNMAGRGVDIKLGGPTPKPEEQEEVRKLGGLFVLGTERHEARRIDDQLRGRSGRQGDPGDTQFYVSTEDDLMRIFQGERIAMLMDRLGVDEDTPIQNRAISKTLEAAQKRVEGYNFDTRKNVVQYDNVINRHRKVVYTIRRRILEGDVIQPEIQGLLEEQVRLFTELPAKNNPKFAEEFQTIIPLSDNRLETIGREKKDKLRQELAVKEAKKLYVEKENELTPEIMRGIEREVYLQVLDTLWMQHLENMQHLREGIHWRSVGQRDPLVEYRVESQKLFDSLHATLREEVLRALFHVHRSDAVTREAISDEHETELTKLAESAVEKGVNEVTGGELNRDSDFSNKVKKGGANAEANHQRNVARKKKKSERQNRKRKH
jgi:preprotein translocase subunit SecA